jgi:hypothetical protein
VSRRRPRAGGPADHRPESVRPVSAVPAAERDAWRRPWEGLDGDLVQVAQALAREAGVEERVSFRRGDPFAADCGEADVVAWLTTGERSGHGP